MDNVMIVVLATLFGPLLAVQTQKWIERSRERINRKETVFQTLMATRSYRISPEHVRALNMIDLAFCGVRIFRKQWRSAAEQAVVDAWRVYHDHLHSLAENAPPDIVTAWEKTTIERLTDLLQAMANDLHYHFDRVQIIKGSYSPRAHSRVDAENQLMRMLFMRAMAGYGDYLNSRSQAVAPAQEPNAPGR